MRTHSTWADPFAKSLAVRAALLADVTRFALGADVHGGKPRRVCGNDGLHQDAVTTSPGGLPAGRTAEALPPNGFEGSATRGAAGRLAVVTQRLHLDLAGGCVDAARACGGSGTTRSRFR